MCGRFTQHHDQSELEARFRAVGSLFPIEPHWNIAPGQPIVALVPHGPEGVRLLEPLRWGLVPSWARDDSIGNRLINARSETAAEKPSFRTALKRRRCLIPADGFYEWERSTRQPWHAHLREGGLFAMAGLWEEWLAPDGSPLRTAAILTTEANPLVAKIHDRMPVILSREDEAAWLAPGELSAEVRERICRPLPAEAMAMVPVHRRVGRVSEDDPALLEPVRLDGNVDSARGLFDAFPVDPTEATQ
ncbi:MAG: SOS response-associated peptidase [Armatimonadota bacterium]